MSLLPLYTSGFKMMYLFCDSLCTRTEEAKRNYGNSNATTAFSFYSDEKQPLQDGRVIGELFCKGGKPQTRATILRGISG